MQKQSFGKIIFILAFLFMSPWLAHRLNAQVLISGGPAVALDLGQYNEYVLSFSGRSIISMLEWQKLPLIKLGGNGQISIGNLSFAAQGFYGLPLQCGKMHDSDWNLYRVKTTYSISNNYAKNNYCFGFGTSYKINFSRFSFIPSIWVDYYYDTFQSNEGHGWYGSEGYSKTGTDVSWNSPDAKYYKKLSRIDLERKELFIFTGFSFSFEIKNKLGIDIGTFIAPYAYTYNNDYHHDDKGTNRDFYLTSEQKMYFARFKESLGLAYFINNSITARLNTNLIFGGIQKGELQGTEQYAGTNLFMVEIKMGVEFKGPSTGSGTAVLDL